MKEESKLKQSPGITVEQIAEICHAANKLYRKTLGDLSQPEWAFAPKWQRESAIAGVKFVIENPDASPEDQHNAWLEQKSGDGWKYGPVKDPAKKEHPCMMAHEDLPRERRAKDWLFRGIVKALIPFADLSDRYQP